MAGLNSVITFPGSLTVSFSHQLSLFKFLEISFGGYIKRICPLVLKTVCHSPQGTFGLGTRSHGVLQRDPELMGRPKVKLVSSVPK